MSKQLAGRMLDIASGSTELNPDKVMFYREQWKLQGFDLPDYVAENRTIAQAKKADRKEQPPDVSTFGTLLRAAVEKEIGKPQSCGQCVGYMRSLNQQTEHDTKAIAQYLFANFAWPHEWREKIGDKHAQKKRIAEIVETIVTAETPGG